MTRARRRSAAWFAVLAMALQALWPLIAQAKPEVPGLRVAVCTIGGVTHYIELEPGKTPLEKRSAAQHEHCAMCLFGGERAAVLPSPALHTLILRVVSTTAFAAPAASAPEIPSYPAAQPRAPPALS